MELKNNLKIFWKTHPFLFCANILSFILSIFPFLYFLFTFDISFMITGFQFLVPYVCVLGISFLVVKFSIKHPIICNILSFLINILIIFFVQLLLGFFIWDLEHYSIIEKNCSKIQNYEQALTYYPPQRIFHLPKKIPDDAKNIQYKTSIFNFFGSQSIYLCFDIDKDYIENELKQYKFIHQYDLKDKNTSFPYSIYTGGIDINDFTFYIINDRNNENLPGHHFPYHYGIGVNPQHTRILYYYDSPD